MITLRGRRLLVRALRDCIQEKAPSDALRSAVRIGLVEPLLKRAAYHNVVGHVRLGLEAVNGIDDDVRAELEEQRRLALAGHMRALADLAVLARVLNEADIPWVTFKGPMLSELIYRRGDIRRYADVDVLVSPSAFGAAIGALEGSGLSLADRNWEAIRSEQRGQLHVRLPMGTEADIHWDLAINARVRRGFAIDVEGLLQRTAPADLGPARARVLDPTDAVLHLCLHAGLDGGHRLIWLKDIQQMIAARPPDWDVLAARAAQWRARLLIAAVLRRAGEVAGADVPKAVLRRLAGRALLEGCRLLDRVFLPDRSTSHYSVSPLLTRSARDGIGSSAQALVETVRSVGLRSPQARRALSREPFGAFADGPLSPYEPSGSDEDRESYLRDIGSAETQ